MEHITLRLDSTNEVERCYVRYNYVLVIHSSIQYSVWRQVQSLLQNDAST